MLPLVWYIRWYMYTAKTKPQLPATCGICDTHHSVLCFVCLIEVSMQCFEKAREQLTCTGSDMFLLQKPTVCHKCKCTLYQQILYEHSLSSVLTLRSTLHAPAPISDNALTLIM